MAVVTAVACTSAQSGARSADPTTPPGGSGWAGDIDVFVATLEAVHPEPYHSASREDLATAVADLKRQLPQMTEWEAVVGFQRLLGLLTSEGRDGHMVLRPADRTDDDWRMFPIQLYWFADGFHVVAAKDDPTLVGAKLTRVGDTPVGAAVRELRPLITKDNAMTVRSRMPAYLEAPDILIALGLVDPDNESLTFVHEGKEVTPDLEPIPVEEHSDWLGLMHPYVRRLPPRAGAMFLRNQAENVRVAYLGAADTVYVAFNVVRPPFGDAIAKIESLMEARRVRRVVLDLRHNPGGETGLYGPLLSALSQPEIDRPGKLFALTSRTTFSAAANFLADLDERTCVLITGEAPGAAPRFWNDNDPITLPYSGFEVGVATRWWGKGGKRHPGTTFQVDLPVTYRSTDFLRGSDPALEEALGHDGRECP